MTIPICVALLFIVQAIGLYYYFKYNFIFINPINIYNGRSIDYDLETRIDDLELHSCERKTFRFQYQRINLNCGIFWLSGFQKVDPNTPIDFEDLKSALISISGGGLIGKNKMKVGKLFLCSVRPYNKEMIKLLSENGWHQRITYNNMGGSDGLQVWANVYI